MASKACLVCNDGIQHGVVCDLCWEYSSAEARWRYQLALAAFILRARAGGPGLRVCTEHYELQRAITLLVRDLSPSEGVAR